jgi:inhibitor of KinA sporulation pathway (predicted exonuclease)/8-oxo-dGTP pyrophosphatase MutT (NUDIX family)
MASFSMKECENNEEETYWLVMDFEATCEENDRHWKNEIIEFPAILMRSSDGIVLSEFESFVKPIERPKLTSFCTKLTSIKQEHVNEAPMLGEVLYSFNEWLNKYTNNQSNCSILPIFCGDWDLKTCLPNECIRKNYIGIVPKCFESWCNIKYPFESILNKKSRGMANMLKQLNLKLLGNHHRGIDDSRNIARILAELVGRGGKSYIKPTMNYNQAGKGGGKAYSISHQMFIQSNIFNVNYQLTQASYLPVVSSQETSPDNQSLTTTSGAAADGGGGGDSVVADGSGGGGTGSGTIDNKGKYLNKGNSTKAARRALQEQQRARKSKAVNLQQDKYFSAVCRPLSVRDRQRAMDNNMEVMDDRSVGTVCICSNFPTSSTTFEDCMLLIKQKRRNNNNNNLPNNVSDDNKPQMSFDTPDWEFPKGHPNENESDIDAAIRETQEETGILPIISSSSSSSLNSTETGYSYIGHLHIDKWCKHKDFPDQTKRPILVIHKTVRYFLAYIDDIKQAQDCIGKTSESAQVAWVPISKADQVFRHPESLSVSQTLLSKAKTGN